MPQTSTLTCTRWMALPCSWILIAAAVVSPLQAQDELQEEASWTAPTWEAVKGQFMAEAEGLQLADADLQRLQDAWTETSADDAPMDLLTVSLKSIGILAPQTADVVGQLVIKQSPFEVIDRTHLEDESISPWIRKQLTLGIGVWYTQHQLYDEAIETLADLKSDEVMDPASLLFYRGLAYQQVINKDGAMGDLKRLLEREPELPRRFRDVSRLVVADLQSLEPDSLDEIARMMDDIRRRQGLFRSGTPRVRKEEDDVIAKLDKLIEELEKQQQQMMMAAAGNAPSSPAPDSVLKGGPAPGDVDQKAQGTGEDGETYPAKERAAAMAELAKDLPSHYRELIEDFYRKLAEDPNASGN